MVLLCVHDQMECSSYLSLEVPSFESAIFKAIDLSSSCLEENLNPSFSSSWFLYWLLLILFYRKGRRRERAFNILVMD